MNTNQMRNLILGHYGPGFRTKLNKMSDKQVQAMYFRMKNKGELK